MPEVITVSCPICGFEQQTSQPSDRFLYLACGNVHHIDLPGNERSLHPVSAKIANVDQVQDAQIKKKTIASTKGSITRLNKKIKSTRSGTGLLSIFFIVVLGGLSIVIGLVNILNFIGVEGKSLNDIKGLFICGILPLIGGALFVFMSFSQRDADKVKLIELEAQLAQKRQELAEQQNILSDDDQSDAEHTENN